MISNFLKQYTANKHTYAGYKRDLKKLSEYFAANDKDVDEATTEDIKQFLISNKRLAPASVRTLIKIIGAYYSYLVSIGKRSNNPVSMLRQKNQFTQATQTTREIRKLSETQLSYAFKAAEKLAYEHPTEHSRTLFIFNAMFYMYLRISEFTATSYHIPRMNDFKRDLKGRWWFTTVGKGNKLREIVVSDKMLAAVVHYRSTLKLPLLPYETDYTFLITKHKGSGPVTDTSSIRRDIQKVYDLAEVLMHNDGHIEESVGIRKATVHWMRHTGISYDLNVKKRSITHVRDDAGHGSINITDKYWDVTKDERHSSK